MPYVAFSISLKLGTLSEFGGSKSLVEIPFHQISFKMDSRFEEYSD